MSPGECRIDCLSGECCYLPLTSATLGCTPTCKATQPSAFPRGRCRAGVFDFCISSAGLTTRSRRSEAVSYHRNCEAPVMSPGEYRIDCLSGECCYLPLTSATLGCTPTCKATQPSAFPRGRCRAGVFDFCISSAGLTTRSRRSEYREIMVFDN